MWLISDRKKKFTVKKVAIELRAAREKNIKGIVRFIITHCCCFFSDQIADYLLQIKKDISGTDAVLSWQVAVCSMFFLIFISAVA